MNKKTVLSFVLSLALGASLFAMPAFADGTVIVIGGAVQQGALPTATYDAAGPSAVVVSGNDGRNVVISSSGNAAAATANTGMKSSVVVMPDGQVQQITAQPVQQAQTQTAAQQGIQTSSAQTAAASTPAVVTPVQNTVPPPPRRPTTWRRTFWPNSTQRARPTASARCGMPRSCRRPPTPAPWRAYRTFRTCARTGADVRPR